MTVLMLRAGGTQDDMLCAPRQENRQVSQKYLNGRGRLGHLGRLAIERHQSSITKSDQRVGADSAWAQIVVLWSRAMDLGLGLQPRRALPTLTLTLTVVTEAHEKTRPAWAARRAAFKVASSALRIMCTATTHQRERS